MATVKSKQYEMLSNDGTEVTIRFLDSDLERKYKVIDLNSIKTKIEEGKEINLDGCYIKDFSYQELSGDERKPLVGFSAAYSFWDGIMDFGHAKFGNGDVDFSNAHFGNGDVDFSDTHFGNGSVDFCAVEFGNGDVDFCNTEFGDGDVDFRATEFESGNVYFSGAEFGDGIIDFSGVQFGDGNVDFSNAKFRDGAVKFRCTEFGGGIVDFSDVYFGNGDVDFFLAQFGDSNVFFNDAEFGNGNVDFLNAQFGNGDVSFRGSHFGDGNVDFGYAKFGDGSLYFRSTKFGNGNVDFTGAQFGDIECYFDYITARGTSFLFRNIIIRSHITFCSCALKKLVFENCTSHDVIEFQEATDEQTEAPLHNAIEELAFLNFCNLGTIRLNWNVYKKALMEYKGGLEKITEEFQMLKENYHNQGKYDWEDDAYVEFKKLYTKGLQNRPFRKGLLNLLFFVGKFGTDYLSIALTMLAVVLVWGILYALPLASIYPTDAVQHWWSPLYYSVITFFTVGYGDLSAQNGYTAIICGFESFLGVFLMSYFSVAVVRKILR